MTISTIYKKNVCDDFYWLSISNEHVMNIYVYFVSMKNLGQLGQH